MGSNKAIVVRLYEAFGSQISTTLRSQLPFRASQRYTLLSNNFIQQYIKIYIYIYIYKHVQPTISFLLFCHIMHTEESRLEIYYMCPFVLTKCRCNFLEECTGVLEDWSGELHIDFKPFKVVNFLLYF